MGVKDEFIFNKHTGHIKYHKVVLFFGLMIMVAVILSGAVSATGLATSAQPKFHHDNNNTGQSQYNGPQTNNTKWKYTTGKGIFSSPAIGSDGTIYFGSLDDHLYAINPNGTQKWSFNAGDVIGLSPAIGDDGVIYFGSNKMFHALYPNGTEKWNFTTPNWDLITNSPAIGNDGTIYFVTTGSWKYYSNNTLWALNTDGTEKWKFQLIGISLSNPAIGNDGTIYLGDNANYLYAINHDGTEKWKFKASDMVVSSPAIGSDGTIYFGCEDNDTYALYPNGNLKWKYQTGKWIDSCPAIGKDSTIYIVSADGFLYALTPNGNLKWKTEINNGPTFGEISSPAIGNDGTIYCGGEDGFLYAINPNGTLKWKYKTGNSIESSPAIGSDGTLYFGSYDGNLYAIQDKPILPTVNANLKSGLYNKTVIVTLSMSKFGKIYYTIDGTGPTTLSNEYLGPITIKTNTTLKYIAIDLDGNLSQIYNQIYTVDLIPPNVNANIAGGTYNVTKIVTLSMNEKGTIYYTLNGITPTTASYKYTGPISVNSTKTLKFMALDLAGNKSPVYKRTYTIDRTAPKIVSTTPKNNTRGVALTSAITIKFSEKVCKGTNFSKIYIKNMTTGKIVKSTVTIISGNTLTLKMIKSRLSLNNYEVYIPTSAVKDVAGNSNVKHMLNFKTSRY